jgi:hypothetical protein
MPSPPLASRHARQRLHDVHELRSPPDRYQIPIDRSYHDVLEQDWRLVLAHTVVLSLGMGVDSTAILVRWLTDPASRDSALSDLTVLVSQVGDEYPDTYNQIERVVLPNP